MEAPIELFVAVIILTMSMALAFTVWGQLQEQECVAKIKTTMSRLQNAMVYLAQGSPPSTRIETLVFPRCGKYDIKGVQLVYYSNAEYCRLCPGHYGSCWQLVPLSYDGASDKYTPLTDAITCVQLSGGIELSEEPVSNCPSVDRLLTSSCPEPPCKDKIRTAPDDQAKYHSLGRPDEGNTYIVRLTSYSTLGSESKAGKIIKVCALTPQEWAKENP